MDSKPAIIKLLLAAVSLLLSFSLSAQNEEKITIKYEDWKVQNVFLFPEFTQGTVYFTNRGPGALKVNYNKILSTVQFVDVGGDAMSFGNINEISAIIINKREFRPIKDKFIEVIDQGNDDIQLAILWCLKILDVKKEGAYGGSTSVSPNEAMTAFGTNSQSMTIANLKGSDEIILTNKNVYYIGIDNVFSEINKKNLSKLFPKFKNELTNHIDSNKVQFSSEKDIKALYQYIITL